MGWVYNLKDLNATTHAPRLIAICLVFSTVACLAVGLRFYVRIYTKRRPWYDDYAAMSSAILGAAYVGVAIAQTRWGQALDPKAFPPENLIPFSKIQYAGGPIYTLALLGFKVSLLASYLRIGGFARKYSYPIYGVMAACICNQLIFTFVITLACRPIARQWDPSIPGHCIDTVKSYYAIAGTSLGFDVLIIALPIPILWGLKLNKKQKLGLVGVFALGFFVTIIQIIRIFTIKNLKTYTNSEPIVIWSAVEINLGVVLTCIPTYAPLFRAFSQRMTSGHASSQNHHRAGSQYLRSRPTDGSFHNNKSHAFTSKSTNAHELGSVKEHRHAFAFASHSRKGGLSESGSEEHIVRKDAGKIYATTEVTVERQATADD